MTATGTTGQPSPHFGAFKNPSELGSIIRSYRKNQRYTLETVSGLSKLSLRFLSELERGKETAEIGKVLDALNILGLEIIIQPRGFDQQTNKRSSNIQLKDTDSGQ